MIGDLGVFATFATEHGRRNLSTTDDAWVILVKSIQQLGHAFGMVLHVRLVDYVVVDSSHGKVQLVASDIRSHHRGEKTWRPRDIERSRTILGECHRLTYGEVLKRREDWAGVAHRC